MKITGIILILIGLAAGSVCVLQLSQPSHPDRDVAPVGDSQVQRPDMTLPLVACGAAVVIGGLLVMYGGRGYIRTADPRVRN